MDLKQQLQRSMRELVTLYASFVSNVCSSLIKSHVSAEILSSFLLNLPAFKSDQRGRQRGLVLLSDVRNQLESAITIYQVIDTLSVEHASYLNCEVYQSIVGEFGTRKDHERMDNYFERHQDYIGRHKLLEYLELHPARRGTDPTKKLILRLNFNMTMRISELLRWRESFADVLGLWGTTLRMYGIEEGESNTVGVIFLIPATIAEEVFTNLKLTTQQIADFQALNVISIKYCDSEFNVMNGESDASGEGSGSTMIKGQQHAMDMDSDQHQADDLEFDCVEVIKDQHTMDVDSGQKHASGAGAEGKGQQLSNSVEG
jgi:hypothetical protein